MNISYIPYELHSYNQAALDHSNKFLHFLASSFFSCTIFECRKVPESASGFLTFSSFGHVNFRIISNSALGFQVSCRDPALLF